MKRFFVGLCMPLALLAMSLGSASGQETDATEPTKDKKVKIELNINFNGGDKAEKEPLPVEVAILLDTSNSMDGLINQARQQLWQIVLRLAEAEKKGRKPQLRVSVLEYGNTNLPATENYIRQVVPLTDDLDKVSEALFALTTRGGDEYCGAIIKESVERLDWSRDPDAYRAIFIAGNEPFTQGPVNYVNSCGLAVDKGIIVNTIHCGDHSTGVKGMWADGAVKGGGKSFNINQDRKQVNIKCPQDRVLIELNTKLNKTYLWFGSKSSRKSYASNQLAQDSNSFGGGGGMAMGMGGMGGGGMGSSSAPAPSFGSRVASKASNVYDNRKRDLVDAVKADEETLGKLEADKLPEVLQKMTLAQRKKYVADKATERKKIQEEIKKVTKERQKHLVAELTKQGNKRDTFGDAICESIDSQLSERGFQKTK